MIAPRLALFAHVAPFAPFALLALGCAHGASLPVRAAAHASNDDVIGLFTKAPPVPLAVADDAVVRVVGPQMTCSGTLVDDDLVLTAHHCVVARGARGEFMTARVPAASLRVELGGGDLAWGSVNVRAVVAPPCGEAGGGGDVAILVLERKLVGMSTLTVRLDAPPRIGDLVDAVGFGRCALTDGGIRRRDRPGGAVRATTGETFVVDASICPGDSGGPVIARGTQTNRGPARRHAFGGASAGDVVGIVSLSAMDGDECTTSTSVMARLDAYRSVFSAARLIADGASEAELPPLSCPP